MGKYSDYEWQGTEQDHIHVNLVRNVLKEMSEEEFVENGAFVAYPMACLLTSYITDLEMEIELMRILSSEGGDVDAEAIEED